MKASVIVPVHNGAQFLPACIESIEAQSARDFEIICVDDGSTDNTPAILEELAVRYNNIAIVTQPCRGVSAARNAGIDVARGDYLMFVDADDQVAPQTLEVALGQAQQAQAHMAIYGFSEYFGETGDAHPREMCADKALWNTVFAPRDVTSPITEVTTPNVWRILFARDFVRDAGLRFHEDLPSAEDLAFIHEALLVATRVVLVDGLFYKYRRDGGATLTHARRENTGLAALAHVFAFARDHALLDEPWVRTHLVDLVLDTVEYGLSSAYDWEEFERLFAAFQVDWMPFVRENEGLISARYRPFYEAVAQSSPAQYLFHVYAIVRDANEWRMARMAALEDQVQAAREETRVAREEADALRAQVDEMSAGRERVGLRGLFHKH